MLPVWRAGLSSLFRKGGAFGHLSELPGQQREAPVLPMKAACGCLPGTPENGWHEIQSEACRQAEKEAWREFFARVPEYIEQARLRIARR